MYPIEGLRHHRNQRINHENVDEELCGAGGGGCGEGTGKGGDEREGAMGDRNHNSLRSHQSPLSK